MSTEMQRRKIESRQTKAVHFDSVKTVPSANERQADCKGREFGECSATHRDATHSGPLYSSAVFYDRRTDAASVTGSDGRH